MAINPFTLQPEQEIDPRSKLGDFSFLKTDAQQEDPKQAIAPKPDGGTEFSLQAGVTPTETLAQPLVRSDIIATKDLSPLPDSSGVPTKPDGTTINPFLQTVAGKNISSVSMVDLLTKSDIIKKMQPDGVIGKDITIDDFFAKPRITGLDADDPRADFFAPDEALQAAVDEGRPISFFLPDFGPTRTGTDAATNDKLNNIGVTNDPNESVLTNVVGDVIPQTIEQANSLKTLNDMMVDVANNGIINFMDLQALSPKSIEVIEGMLTGSTIATRALQAKEAAAMAQGMQNLMSQIGSTAASAGITGGELARLYGYAHANIATMLRGFAMDNLIRMGETQKMGLDAYLKSLQYSANSISSIVSDITTLQNLDMAQSAQQFNIISFITREAETNPTSAAVLREWFVYKGENPLGTIDGFMLSLEGNPEWQALINDATVASYDINNVLEQESRMTALGLPFVVLQQVDSDGNLMYTQNGDPILTIRTNVDLKLTDGRLTEGEKIWRLVRSSDETNVPNEDDPSTTDDEPDDTNIAPLGDVPPAEPLPGKIDPSLIITPELADSDGDGIPDSVDSTPFGEPIVLPGDEPTVPGPSGPTDPGAGIPNRFELPTGTTREPRNVLTGSTSNRFSNILNVIRETT